MVTGEVIPIDIKVFNGEMDRYLVYILNFYLFYFIIKYPDEPY